MAKFFSEQAQVQFETQLHGRIKVGRAVLEGQKIFFWQHFGQVESSWKEDKTRVTFADLVISESVFSALQRDFLEDDYCSEEMSPSAEVLLLNSGFTWMIDPIDGTNNYALGFPICAISLALLYDGVPVYGFIYDYSTDSLFEGGPGLGVLRNQKKISRDHLAANPQIMLGLHFPIEPERLDRLKPLLAKYRVRCIGSGALNATYVATGYLTGVIDFRVKVWDIAAAYALCAGANVSFDFLAENPFPLRQFHSQMDFCPYFAGAEYFYKELKTHLCD